MTKIFALGAADVEMSRIENLLEKAGFEAVYAAVSGVRCHPGNAYKCDSFVSPNGETVDLSDYPEIIRVECDGPAFAGLAHSGPSAPKVVVVDHHRQGDPGYGLPPERFLEASSIGQVRDILSSARCLRKPDELTLAEFNAHIRMVAAADHCLESAYRGRCPGVDPDTLMRFRAEQRAAFRKVSVEQVLTEIEAARQRLVYHTKQGSCFFEGSLRIADLRGESVSELPEAACREGIPFVADQTDRDGRRKVVLMAVPQGTGLVKKFMAGAIVPGLKDFYGDPARGFAGGYCD